MAGTTPRSSPRGQMARYVAFLRGVSPMNAKMPELKRCFESANFSDVRTLLTSGNVVFTARSASADSLQRRAEAAMRRELPRVFSTFIREATHLQQLIDSDPYAQFELPPEAKRVVSFLRAPIDTPVRLPIEQAGGSILAMTPSAVLSAYIPSADAPAFMRLLERILGADITTRTLDTVRKCAWA